MKQFVNSRLFLLFQIQNIINGGKIMRDISNSKGKIFRHFKGDLYLVEDFVKHSETQETMVLYRALYGDCGLFVRPYEMFIEEVPEGKINPTGQKYRFQEFEVKSVK